LTVGTNSPKSACDFRAVIGMAQRLHRLTPA
jgi:hypothetical protein